MTVSSRWVYSSIFWLERSTSPSLRMGLFAFRAILFEQWRRYRAGLSRSISLLERGGSTDLLLIYLYSRTLKMSESDLLRTGSSSLDCVASGTLRSFESPLAKMLRKMSCLSLPFLFQYFSKSSIYLYCETPWSASDLKNFSTVIDWEFSIVWLLDTPLRLLLRCECGRPRCTTSGLGSTISLLCRLFCYL